MQLYLLKHKIHVHVLVLHSRYIDQLLNAAPGGTAWRISQFCHEIFSLKYFSSIFTNISHVCLVFTDHKELCSHVKTVPSLEFDWAAAGPGCETMELVTVCPPTCADTGDHGHTLTPLIIINLDIDIIITRYWNPLSNNNLLTMIVKLGVEWSEQCLSTHSN